MENFWKKEENNIEIQNIEILNNGKVEKNKLFLLEIEDEINLKIEIDFVMLRLLMFILLECKKNLEGQRRINYKWENKQL